MVAITDNFTVDILDHDLVRVCFTPDGTPRLDHTWAFHAHQREGRLRDDYSPFTCPDHETIKTDTHITLKTEQLTITINTLELGISWQANGKTFASDTPFRAYRTQGRQIYHYMRRDEQDLYLGFGERAGKLNKHGHRLRMHNLDALGYNAETSDPLYKHFPFFITYNPELDIAYGLFYDNFSSCVFDLGKEIDAYHGYYRYYKADDGDLDYYLIYGESIAAVAQKFSHLIGHMAMPPRWSLGYLGSTMLYTELPDAQHQLKQFAELCAAHNIPCDMFHLSSGYTTGADGSRYVFTWNTDKVPDPQGMVKNFHDNGIRLCANIKPYLLKSHPYYDEVKAFNGFIQNPEQTAPQTEILWSGGAFESAEGAYLDFTNPETYQWWQQNATQQLLDYGIDSLWNDNNEFEIWDNDAICHTGDRLGMLRPIQTLLMTRASYKAQQAHNPTKRPFVLCRSGLPGIQRYAQTWSGDNETSWHTLQWNIPMGLGMSLSGAPNTGHDVGGFFGAKPDPELFLRWVQAGIFQPRFTIHSYNTDGTVNEPWMYPEILPQVRQAIEFRYRLIPYLYSLMWDAHLNGTPIMRPILYEFPTDPETYDQNFNYLLGTGLLVAPIYHPQAETWDVYLPDGVTWCDYYSGQWHNGGQTITVQTSPDHIPLFAKAGAMIPLGKSMKFVGATSDNIRQIMTFPAKREQKNQFTLYEDDGISADAPLTRVMLTCESTADTIQLSVQVDGDYQLPYSKLEFILPIHETRPVTSYYDRAFTDDQGRQHISIKVNQ